MDQWGCANASGGVNATVLCDASKRRICRPRDLYAKGCSKINTSLSDCDAENTYLLRQTFLLFVSAFRFRDIFVGVEQVHQAPLLELDRGAADDAEALAAHLRR